MLALSQAELERNRLALPGKGGEEMLIPLLGAYFGVRGITVLRITTGAGLQCSGNLVFLCCKNPFVVNTILS